MVAIFQVVILLGTLIETFLQGETVADFWNLWTMKGEPEFAFWNLLVFLNLFFLSFIHLSIWWPTLQNWKSTLELNRKEVRAFRLRLPPRSQVLWSIHAGASMVCWVWSGVILAFYSIFSGIRGSLLDMGIVGWILVPLMLIGAEYILFWAIPKHFTRRKLGEAGGSLAMKPT